MLPSHSATSPPPHPPTLSVHRHLKPSQTRNQSSAALTYQKKKKRENKKKEQNKVHSEAALAMTVWIQQQIVPSVLLGPASSLQKRQTEGEREREKGRQGGRERLLAHSVTTMRLSAALSREHGLPGSACKWLQLPSIRSPSAPRIHQNASPDAPAATEASAQRGCGEPGPGGSMPAAGDAAARPLSAGVSNHRLITSPPPVGLSSQRRRCCTGDAAPSQQRRQAMLLWGEGSSVA